MASGNGLVMREAGEGLMLGDECWPALVGGLAPSGGSVAGIERGGVDVAAIGER